MGASATTSLIEYEWVSAATPGRSAAIGVLQLFGDAQAIFDRLDLRAVQRGEAALRNLGGVDSGVVARTSNDAIFITPHAGAAVRRLLTAWLEERGVVCVGSSGAIGGASHRCSAPADLAVRFPEASSQIEAAMLAALSRASSPLAIDLLLDQPRRWAALGINTPTEFSNLPPHDRDDIHVRSKILNRLLIPPQVVAIGPPNIGKSTLLNTLAKRGVSLVADMPGTTRDHVGVRLDLAGLVVQYIDTPGVGTPTSDIDRQAQLLALEAAADANLVLLCADPTSKFLPPFPSWGDTLRVALRADLGDLPNGTDIPVCAVTGAGIESLVQAIVERLVPSAVFKHPGPWLFWETGTSNAESRMPSA